MTVSGDGEAQFFMEYVFGLNGLEGMVKYLLPGEKRGEPPLPDIRHFLKGLK